MRGAVMAAGAVCSAPQNITQVIDRIYLEASSPHIKGVLLPSAGFHRSYFDASDPYMQASAMKKFFNSFCRFTVLHAEK